jgi:hypothetical protein
MKNLSRDAGQGARAALGRYNSGQGRAEADNAWNQYQGYVGQLNPATMLNDLDNNKVYQALYGLSTRPIHSQYEQEYGNLTGSQSARNLSDSSVGAYQRHLLQKQRDEQLMTAGLQSQLGTVDQMYRYGDTLRQNYGDAYSRSVAPISEAQALAGIQNTAYNPVLQHNQRGYNTVKTGLGNVMDFAQTGANIYKTIKGGR